MQLLRNIVELCHDLRVLQLRNAGLVGVLPVETPTCKLTLLHGFVGVEQVLQQFALVETQTGFHLIATSVELSVVAVTTLEYVIHHRLLHPVGFIILIAQEAPAGWHSQFNPYS